MRNFLQEALKNGKSEIGTAVRDVIEETLPVVMETFI
jgi:hypothetical protein